MKWIAIAAFLAGTAFGQTATAPPAFESSDVQVSPPSTNPNMRGGALRDGRYSVRNATMLDLIRMAYRLDTSKIVGGPNWLEWDRFDVLAKAPPSRGQEDVGTMLQDLLAARFKLVVHKATMVRPAYALLAGKGKNKLNEAAGTGSPGCRGVPNQAPGSVTYQVMACKGVTMAMFAEVLWNWEGGSYLLDPVVDQTALAGTWDFELKWSPRNQLAQAGSEGITLFDAIDKQLGLKLAAQKSPMEVLVVDAVNQTPTPNAADVLSKIPPPPPTEFEVAIIKPSAPDANGQRGNIRNGRLDIQNFTLKQLIRIAWDLSNNDEMIRGLPNSADSLRYDVTAKVSTAGGVKSEDVDFDTLRMMLRGLLIERFGLKAHMEDRPVSAYTMTATKRVNLQKADPQNRTNCQSGAGPTPVINRLIRCQNTNMAQFGVVLQQIVAGYVNAPIKDATGLDGYYDFSVSFSGINLLPGGRFDPNRTAETTDPNGALPLPEALQKQLGLKLEMEKRPLPVLVVDHVNEKPTEN